MIVGRMCAEKICLFLIEIKQRVQIGLLSFKTIPVQIMFEIRDTSVTYRKKQVFLAFKVMIQQSFGYPGGLTNLIG